MPQEWYSSWAKLHLLQLDNLKFSASSQVGKVDQSSAVLFCAAEMITLPRSNNFLLAMGLFLTTS